MVLDNRATTMNRIPYQLKKDFCVTVEKIKKTSQTITHYKNEMGGEKKM